jgi:glucose/arabinose dehydrogenase
LSPLKVRTALFGLGVLAALVLAACASTDPATSISESGATLNGHVHPRGIQTTWWFEYGPTTTYASQTAPEVMPAGDSSVAVSEHVTGLASGTLYHYRLCDVGSDGRGNCGDDQTFTTATGRLAPGFSESVPIHGLTEPTAVRIAPDGRIFVAEKSGLIKVFDDLDDTSPTVFADLRDETYNQWDRGLLGLALDPQFPARPFVYVAYSYDAVIGGKAPLWGTPGATGDPCPTPPGPIGEGCVGSGRISRLTADGNRAVGPEQVLVEDFCQQFPVHSMSSLVFAPDGSLYAGAGDAAHPFEVDYGEYNDPCGDPPNEGGALRAQDLRTAGDPAGLTGSIIRIDPDTGEGVAANPGAASLDRNVRRIVGEGVRNPFRMAVRPGTNELWIGDVGWRDVEEIDRLSTPPATSADDFGWPCYEGAGRQPGYDDADVGICESLYSSGVAKGPFFTYLHSDHVAPGETCTVGSSAVTGLAFSRPGPYPSSYDGALFFADQPRKCIWVMKPDANGVPNPAAVTPFVQQAGDPVDLQIGPSGDLFYVDFAGGAIHRLVYSAGNQPPVALATADKTSGGTPLTVKFDGSTSDDPDSSSPLSYAWDLDGDGAYDDSNAAQPTFTYTTAGTYAVKLRVTDAGGAVATDTLTITVGNTPPVATIAAPSPGFQWRVGDPVAYSGAAVDAQDGTLPAAALSWALIIHHCPSDCHIHSVTSWTGASGTFVAPDHEYPSYLELRLTATDSGGLTDTQTIRLDPRTVDVTMQSAPAGLTLFLNGVPGTAPFTRTVIEHSANTISAGTPQIRGGSTLSFQSWSDGGARTHAVTIDQNSTYTATFSSP